MARKIAKTFGGVVINLLKHSYLWAKAIPIRIRKIMWAFRTLEFKNAFSALKHLKIKREHWVKFRNNQGTHCSTLALNFLDKYQGKHIKDDYYLWTINNHKMYGTYVHLHRLLYEFCAGIFDIIYDCEVKNKRILDIGSYIGESATFFLNKNAQKVICYEPVPINFGALKLNLKKYEDRVEYYEMAMGKESGMGKICSNAPLGELCFGPSGDESSQYILVCQFLSLSDMLSRHDVDIVKMDCEGAEMYMADTPIELLKKVPYWIIETHGKHNHELVSEQMQKAGFAKVKVLNMIPDIDVVHFAYGKHHEPTVYISQLL